MYRRSISVGNRHVLRNKTLTQVPCRLLSTAATASATNKAGDKPNIFLDNLGSLFLGGIGLVIATLIRSWYGTQNKNRVRDRIEQESALDPCEIDDLRQANRDVLPYKAFLHVLRQVDEEFPDKIATYESFSNAVRRSLIQYHGNNPTASLQLGHLLDRVALDVVTQSGGQATQPMYVWFTLLSLALSAPVPERVQALWQVLRRQPVDNDVTIEHIQQLVESMQKTCQLVPDAHVIAEQTHKYPTQQYRKATSQELVPWNDEDRSQPVDINTLDDILRSKSVCAWGECYHKKKHA